MRFAIHKSHHLLLQTVLALAFITIVAILLSECSSLGQNKVPERVDGFQSDIPNLMNVRETIYSGGQPTAEGLRRLSELGVKTIVNFRLHDESGARDESREAAELGIKYFHIPLTPNTFTHQKIEYFQKLLADKANYPIFLHCGTGNRSAGMWFVYRVLFEHASTAEALAEAKSLGLQQELERKLQELLSQQ